MARPISRFDFQPTEPIGDGQQSAKLASRDRVSSSSPITIDASLRAIVHVAEMDPAGFDAVRAGASKIQLVTARPMGTRAAKMVALSLENGRLGLCRCLQRDGAP